MVFTGTSTLPASTTEAGTYVPVDCGSAEFTVVTATDPTTPPILFIFSAILIKVFSRVFLNALEQREPIY